MEEDELVVIPGNTGLVNLSENRPMAEEEKEDLKRAAFRALRFCKTNGAKRWLVRDEDLEEMQYSIMMLGNERDMLEEKVEVLNQRVKSLMDEIRELKGC